MDQQSNVVVEEKSINSFNVSQGQEALELASNNSFQTIGDDLDTALHISSNSLSSPDSAIGGTPGVTPDSETPLNQFQSHIGKISGMDEITVEPNSETPKSTKLLEELKVAPESDTPPESKPSSVSSSLSFLESPTEEEDFSMIEVPTTTLVDIDTISEKPVAKDTAKTSSLEPLISFETNSKKSKKEDLLEAVHAEPVVLPVEPIAKTAFSKNIQETPHVKQVTLMEEVTKEPLKKDKSGTAKEPPVIETEGPISEKSLKRENELIACKEPLIMLENPAAEKAVLEKAPQEPMLSVGKSLDEKLIDTAYDLEDSDVSISGSVDASKLEEEASTMPSVDIKFETNDRVLGKLDTVSEVDIKPPFNASVMKSDTEDEASAMPTMCVTDVATSGLTMEKAKASKLTLGSFNSNAKSELMPETLADGQNFNKINVEVCGTPSKKSIPLLTSGFAIPKVKIDLEEDTQNESTEEEDITVKTRVKVIPDVDDDKIEDGGYEEDEEDDEEDDDDITLSENEMVVQASITFPLAKNSSDQSTPSESKEETTNTNADNLPEPVAEVPVQMSIQFAQSMGKDGTPSGCESDIEDNDEEEEEEESSESPLPAAAIAHQLATPCIRVPSDLQLPETVVRLDTPQGSAVFLVGTAHFSQESQEDVANTIRAVKPDIVVVELCRARTAILQLDEETILEESRSLNFKKIQMILKQHGKIQGILYLLLLSVSAHITKQLGMAPGGEFRTAFAEARRSAPGCIIQFGDRPIQVTLSRALSSLSLWHKVKLTWHILTSKEPISKEEVEKCKQRDFIEEMLAEMTGQFPAISEVFVKERDIYLCRSLQAAAQTVPNPMSPTGFAPRVVVGVVGIGHVPGIVERWGKVKDEDIPPIMLIPPTSLSTKILKITFKMSMYGLICYGVYKCLPASAKSSVQSVLKSVVDSLPEKWLK